jgi:hypothetical protein
MLIHSQSKEVTWQERERHHVVEMVTKSHLAHKAVLL